MPGEELISCPACAEPLHRKAVACPRCGFTAEITAYQEQLASLSTICSILTGFGLASLVALAPDASRVTDSLPLTFAAGIWALSSLLLLVVLVLSELFRRQEVSESVLTMPAAERERFARRCEFLLTVFACALLGTAAGVLLLGFHFSPLIGGITLASILLALVITWRAVR
jgi:Na+/melibiose symporter-like transporter